MDGGYLGFGKMTSVGARGKKSVRKFVRSKIFQLTPIFGFGDSDLFLAPRGIVWWIDAISEGVLKFCGVST
jgi:hypothetical protein